MNYGDLYSNRFVLSQNVNFLLGNVLKQKSLFKIHGYASGEWKEKKFYT